MKSRMMISMMVIAMIAAMIGGATMAWFTDSGTTGDAAFAAGTVKIEAGTSMIYGVEQTTGDLYEIDVATGNKWLLYDTPPLSTNINSPNGLAYDNRYRRLYFAVYVSEDPANPSDLYFYDFASDTHVLAGTVPGIVAGA